jgi:hypothetical protein
VIPREVSRASSRAVKRSVRYTRGSTSLAVLLRSKSEDEPRRPLRCCAAEMRDACQVGTLNESMSEMMVVGGKTRKDLKVGSPNETGSGKEAHCAVTVSVVRGT